MSKSTNVTIDNFNAMLGKELNEYHELVSQAIDAASQRAVLTLVQKTKNTAPKKSGAFRRHIAWKEIQRPSRWDHSYVWYVKSPFHRLTHLLVHGHAKANGGRVPGDPFLQKALDEVLPEYEEDVKEALRYDR